MNFFISLTHACQLRCNYCYTGDKFNKSIDFNTLDSAIDFILSKAYNSFGLGFFGGEPLLEWEKLQYTVEKLEKLTSSKNLKFYKTLTTNGLLLSKDKLNWLNRHNFFLVVSIDGNSIMHNTHRVYPNGEGSFKNVKSAIVKAVEIFRTDRFSTITVVTPQNISNLSDSIKYLHRELNIKRIRVSIDYFAKWNNDTSDILAEFNKLKKYILECYHKNIDIYIDIIDDKIRAYIENSCFECNFGEFKIGIAPSGNLYPCERLIGKDTEELAIGNVKYGFNSKALSDIISTRGNINIECKECAYKSRCINSCGCTNYILTGNIALTDATVCFFQKLFIDSADEIANTLYNEKNRLFLNKFYR